MMTYIIIAIIVVFVLLLCFALAIASFSFDNYLENLKNLNNEENSFGISTLEYVENINKKHFANNLKIETCKPYEEHYSHNAIALSNDTMTSNSLASLAIVSHELGHAKQDFEGNKLVKHWKLRKLGRTCGFFFSPLLICGIVLCLLWIFDILPQIYVLSIGLGLSSLAFLIFVFAIILKYKEIKIEKDASEKALDFLKEFLTLEEISKCKKFLYSARLTYWASLFKTLFGWTHLTSKNKMFK